MPAIAAREVALRRMNLSISTNLLVPRASTFQSHSRASADYAVLQNYLFHSLRACSGAIVRACRATKALMWRNVLLVKRYQIRGGFVQFLRLIRGRYGSVADSLPQTAWAVASGHKEPVGRISRMSAFVRRRRFSDSEARIIYLIEGSSLVSLLSCRMKNGQ